MSELTLLILRIGFLALLWLFVLSVVYALRSDLFGAPVRKMKNSATPIYTAPEGAAAGAPAPAAGPAAAVSPDLPSAGSSGPARSLVVLSGIAAGSTIALDSDILTIGRSPDSTLVIVDEYTSTYHARLDKQGDSWVITDLDSTNGTKVAGHKIKTATPLPPFTQVTIGTTSFELRP